MRNYDLEVDETTRDLVYEVEEQSTGSMMFGVGYSSAVVRGDRIYLTGTLEGQMSHVFELDLDGKELRRLPYGTETTKDMAAQYGANFY